MTSAINPNVPVAGNPTTASVRANFATAAQEISALQDNTNGAPFLPLVGAQMRGPINLFNDPTAPMHPVTLGYFLANGGGGGGGGGGGVPEAPADGTLYGRQDGAWLPAVNTAQMNAAIAAAPFLPISGGTLTGMLTLSGPPTVALHAASKGYVDTNFLSLTGGTLTGPLVLAADAAQPLQPTSLQQITAKNYVPQIGPTLSIAVVENQSGTSFRTPCIAGNVTPYNSSSDGFIVAARQLATPVGNINIDGAFLSVYGPGGNPANTIILFAGNNTAGYYQFRFNPNGSASIPGQLTVGGSAYTPGSPLVQLYTNGANACIRYNAYGLNVWDVGCVSDQNFNFLDVTGGSYRATITTAGQFQINPNSSGIASLIVNGGRGLLFNATCPYGTGNMFVFAWNSPNAGVINCAVDGGGVIQGFQPVSDARMKDEIAPTRFDCLAAALKIPLHEFRWRDASDPEKIATATPLADAPLQRVGLIAQEVVRVFPEGVMQGDETTDKLGHLWQIEANIMLALAFGAIKQLAARVVALETKGH